MDIKSLNPSCVVKLPVKQRGIFSGKEEIIRVYQEVLPKRIFAKMRGRAGNQSPMPHASDVWWDAEDVSQEVFLNFSREHLVLEEGKEIALLATIASYALKDFYKKDQKRVGKHKVDSVTFDDGDGEEEGDIFDCLDLGTSISPERYVLTDESKGLLMDFIDTSSRRERDVATAVWLNDLTVSEAAIELGLSPANVHTHISILRKKLLEYCKYHNFLPIEEV